MRGSSTPLLLVALVAGASGLTTSSPATDAVAHEAAASLPKADIDKALGILRTKVGPLFAVAQERFDHLLEGGSRRKLQDLGAILGSASSGGSPQQILAGLRSQVCTNDFRRLAAQLPTLAAQQGITLPSITSEVDKIWPCLCSASDGLDLSAQAYTDAITAVTSGSTERIQRAVQAVVPVFFSSQGICTSSCRDGGIALLDWIIRVADILIAIPQVQSSLGWLPSISSGLNGLPAKLASCLCDGFKWSSLMALFDSEITTLINDGLSVLSGNGGLSTLTSPATQTAFATLAKYPTFIFSRDGICSTTGCYAMGKQLATYGQSVITAVLQQFGSSIPPAISSAASGVSLVDIHSCFCGGTMDWTKLISSLTSLFSLAPTGDISSIDQLTPIIAGALSSVFSPDFLCSSASCKLTTSDLMTLVDALKTAFLAGSPVAPELAFTSIAWCPAETSSGTKIKQDFTLAGTVDSFGAAQQTSFKNNFVSAINAGITDKFLKVTTGQVSLTVSAASINVEAAIDVASPSLATAVSSQMTTMASQSPTALSSTLGVTVEAVAAPQTSTLALKVSSGGGGGGSSSSSSSTGAIVGGIAGASGAIFGIFGFMMMMKKKKANKASAAAPVAVTEITKPAA